MQLSSPDDFLTTYPLSMPEGTIRMLSTSIFCSASPVLTSSHQRVTTNRTAPNGTRASLGRPRSSSSDSAPGPSEKLLVRRIQGEDIPAVPK